MSGSGGKFLDISTFCLRSWHWTREMVSSLQTIAMVTAARGWVGTSRSRALTTDPPCEPVTGQCSGVASPSCEAQEENTLKNVNNAMPWQWVEERVKGNCTLCFLSKKLSLAPLPRLHGFSVTILCVLAPWQHNCWCCHEPPLPPLAPGLRDHHNS